MTPVDVLLGKKAQNDNLIKKQYTSPYYFNLSSTNDLNPYHSQSSLYQTEINAVLPTS
jgi:hypothetical protein